jgi:DNA-binding GntR family transcriptional regulator
MGNETSEIMESIRGEILSGHLKPGIRLDERELAARFATSKTPVGEALIRMAARNLISLHPHRGAVVAGLNTEQLIMIYEMQIELGTLSARLAAQRILWSNLENWPSFTNKAYF